MSSPRCLAPFVTGIFSASRNAPCGSDVGATYAADVKADWNNPEVVQLRQDMLDGKLSRICQKCIADSSTLASQHHMQAPQAHFDKYMRDVPIDSLPFKPYNVCIANTRECNLGCMMCNASQATVPGRLQERLGLEPDEYGDKLYTDYRIDDVIESQPDMVFYLGGEPMLDPDFDSIVDRFSEYQPRFGVITNGTISHTRGGQTLTEIGAKFGRANLLVSIDGTKGVNEYQRVFAKHEKIIQTIDDAVASGVWTEGVCLNIVVTNIAVMRLAEFIDFAMDRWGDKVHFLVVPSQAPYTDELMTDHYPVYSSCNLPSELKSHVMLQLNQAMRKYRNKPDVVEACRITIKTMIHRHTVTDLWGQFVRVCNKYDKRLKRSILDVLPEFEAYWDDL